LSKKVPKVVKKALTAAIAKFKVLPVRLFTRREAKGLFWQLLLINLKSQYLSFLSSALFVPESM
jgi:hypothetical protein